MVRCVESENKKTVFEWKISVTANRNERERSGLLILYQWEEDVDNYDEDAYI